MDQFQYKINYFIIVQIVVYTIDISTEYYCVVLKIRDYVIMYALV